MKHPPTNLPTILTNSTDQEVLATMPVVSTGYGPVHFPTLKKTSEFNRKKSSLENEENVLGLKLLGDIVVGCGITFAVAPFMTTVDKAIVQRAAGTHTIVSSVTESTRMMLSNPVSFVKSPVFLMMWGVYAATYCTANCIKTVNEHYRVDSTNSKMTLFVGTTVVNSGTTLLKDRAYATMFGTSGAAPKVPLVTFGLWALRDCLVIGSSFVLPDLVGSTLQRKTQMNQTEATRFAQLFCPIATQVIAGPIQLLGLDFYNRPMDNHSRYQAFLKRTFFLGSNFFSILGARIARIAPAYGIGGIGNTHFRDEWKRFIKKQQELEPTPI